MRLFILGASGKTGVDLMDLALKKGHRITAFVRSPEKIAIAQPGLDVIKGSPSDVEDMSRAMIGHDAVFSALGPKPREVFTALKNRSWTMEDFVSKTILAMQKASVARLVLFSSAGLFPGGSIFERFLSFLGRNHMKDLRRMEKAVTDSPLNWTIVRPTWLAKTQDEEYRAETGALPSSPATLSHRALAKFMLDSAEQGLYPRQIVGLSR